MADALGPLPALHSQAAPAGLVAVHPAGCTRGAHVDTEGRRQGQVPGEEETVAGSSEGREGESPREEARREESPRGPRAGWRERERVRQRDGRQQKHGGKQKSEW